MIGLDHFAQETIRRVSHKLYQKQHSFPVRYLQLSTSTFPGIPVAQRAIQYKRLKSLNLIFFLAEIV